MYESICFPTDGSESAAGALDHALTLASDYDATLQAVYVVDEAAAVDDPSAVESLRDALERQGQAVLEEVAEKAEAAGVSVETTVLRGSPSKTIVEFARGHDVDLIVMGTHGRSGASRHVLGSVAERIVRSSPVPVLTVRLEEE